MKVSDFCGKIIESTAGKRGYVISVNARAGKVVCLVCADENERKFRVDINSVISFKEKIIFEDGGTAEKNSLPLRLGRACFDESGKYLGVLEDFILTKDRITGAKIGKKRYPAESLAMGDVVIVKKMRLLKDDVEKDGKIILRKGTPLTEEALIKAQQAGEYVQANLKTF